MKWLVLCDNNDLSALGAYQKLRDCGLEPLELIGGRELIFAVDWEHRLNGSTIYTSITLGDGRQLQSDALKGVLNRISYLPIGHWHAADQADKDYVRSEWSAFFLSWLSALPCPVINRPTPLGLFGRWRHESEWIWLAIRAGLPVPTYRQSSYDRVRTELGEGRLTTNNKVHCSVVVFNGRVYGSDAGGDIPDDIAGGCVRLAERASTELLGIQFSNSEKDGLSFLGATPFPDLRTGGMPLIEALAEAMRRDHRS
jgi:hypothetical protein